MKWRELPNGPMFDLDSVRAVETGKFGTGCRLVLDNGHTIEHPADLSAMKAALKELSADPRDAAVERLKQENVDLQRKLLRTAQGGVVSHIQEGSHDDGEDEHANCGVCGVCAPGEE